LQSTSNETKISLNSYLSMVSKSQTNGETWKLFLVIISRRYFLHPSNLSYCDYIVRIKFKSERRIQWRGRKRHSNLNSFVWWSRSDTNFDRYNCNLHLKSSQTVTRPPSRAPFTPNGSEGEAVTAKARGGRRIGCSKKRWLWR